MAGNESWLSVRLLGATLDVTLIGTLSEVDGMATLREPGDAVDVVVIGGAYSASIQRNARAGDLGGWPDDGATSDNGGGGGRWAQRAGDEQAAV